MRVALCWGESCRVGEPITQDRRNVGATEKQEDLFADSDAELLQNFCVAHTALADEKAVLLLKVEVRPEVTEAGDGKRTGLTLEFDSGTREEDRPSRLTCRLVQLPVDRLRFSPGTLL